MYESRQRLFGENVINNNKEVVGERKNLFNIAFFLHRRYLFIASHSLSESLIEVYRLIKLK